MVIYDLSVNSTFVVDFNEQSNQTLTRQLQTLPQISLHLVDIKLTYHGQHAVILSAAAQWFVCQPVYLCCGVRKYKLHLSP